MKKCVYAQLNVLCKRDLFKFSYFVMLFICCASFVYTAIFNIGEYEPDIMSFRDNFAISKANMFSNIIFIAFPIICVIPFCDTLIEDKNKNRLPIILQYCSEKQYYISKLIVSFISGFVTMFIPLLTNLILCVIAYRPFSYSDLTGLASNQSSLYAQGDRYMSCLLFKNLFTQHPFEYCMIFVLFLSIYAGCGCLFAFSLSLNVKSRAMVVLPFFIFNLLLNILSSPLLSIFGFSFSMQNYVLTSTADETLNYLAYIIIVFILIVASVILIPINIKRLENIL